MINSYWLIALQNEKELTSSLVKNWHNNIVHPMELLAAAPSETRNRGVERACREYENKFAKAEAEAKKHAKVQALIVWCSF